MYIEYFNLVLPDRKNVPMYLTYKRENFSKDRLIRKTIISIDTTNLEVGR